MKPIIFDDGTDEITIKLSASNKYVCIDDSSSEVLIEVKAIDKLIEALQQVKKEINNGCFVQGN